MATAQDRAAIAGTGSNECRDNETLVQRAPAVSHPLSGASATAEIELRAEKRGICKATWVVDVTVPGKSAERVEVRSGQVEKGWGIALEVLGFTEPGDRLLVNTIQYAGDYTEYQLEILDIQSRRVRHLSLDDLLTPAEFRDCPVSFYPFGITPEELLLVYLVEDTTPGEQPCIDGTWVFNPRTKKRQQVDSPPKVPLVGIAAGP